MPGQFGLASAAPLMLQVHDVLTNRDSQRGISAPVLPVPANVGVAAICWPLGQPMSRSDPNCRRQRFAWTLDNTTPPTLQALDQPLSVGLMESIWVNAKGLRVDAHCPGAVARNIALWPAPLEPWLPRAERREARIPAADPDCPPPALAAWPTRGAGRRTSSARHVCVGLEASARRADHAAVLGWSDEGRRHWPRA